MAHSVSKLRTLRPVPGVDGIERFEVRDAGVFHDAHQVQAGIRDSPRAIGEADQGEHRSRRPDFGVIGAGGFESGQGKNHIADGARTNEKSSD